MSVKTIKEIKNLQIFLFYFQACELFHFFLDNWFLNL